MLTNFIQSYVDIITPTNNNKNNNNKNYIIIIIYENFFKHYVTQTVENRASQKLPSPSHR